MGRGKEGMRVRRGEEAAGGKGQGGGVAVSVLCWVSGAPHPSAGSRGHLTPGPQNQKPQSLTPLAPKTLIPLGPCPQNPSPPGPWPPKPHPSWPLPFTWPSRPAHPGTLRGHPACACSRP